MLGVVAYPYNLSLREVEARNQVCKVSLGYIVKKTKKALIA
jgi:hypothetical protein